MNEDYMQIIKKTEVNCHHGLNTHLVSHKVMRKYADGLGFVIMGLVIAAKKVMLQNTCTFASSFIK